MKEWAKQTLTNEDCMELLARTPDKFYDLAIVDPPYGIGEDGSKSNSRRVASKKWATPKKSIYKAGGWDKEIPSRFYFCELMRVSKNQIIWGANHFGEMPSSSGWVVWYKKRIGEVNDFSDAELAYTSFKKGVRLFHFPWIGFGAINSGEKRFHPTQKPAALYKWLLSNYAKEGDKILDTHLGSGSIAIACLDMGFELTGCELDADYFVKMQERINIHKAQAQLF